MAKNINMFTNQKETKRAIKAAVDQSRKFLKNQPHCLVCGCTPKPDEWSPDIDNCCFDCV
jgi:hypothetical protein